MLDIFKSQDIPHEILHRKFLFLRDKDYYRSEKELIREWAKDFYDRDNKIINEFQTTFHSSFWEFYLHKVLKSLNYKTLNKYPHPDFMIKDPFNINIEAVVSEIKQNGTPETERTLDDQMKSLSNIIYLESYNKEINEAIIRNSSSIKNKLEKYEDKYSKKDHVEQDTPYVIALASYDQINYGTEYIYSIIPLLYGYYYNNKTKKWEKKNSIIKPETNSPIDLGLFNKEEYKSVSGVLFTNTLTLGKLTSLTLSSEDNDNTIHKSVMNIRYIEELQRYVMQHVPSQEETLFDGLYFLPNPNAKNPVPPQAFDKNHIIHMYVDENGLCFEGRNRPLIARIAFQMFAVLSRHELTKIEANIIASYNNLSISDVVHITPPSTPVTSSQPSSSPETQ